MTRASSRSECHRHVQLNDVGPVAGPPAQALCAAHPDAPAHGTCERCGNFVCAICTEDGRFSACSACRERVGLLAFPLRRDAWSTGEPLSYAWTVWKRDWLVLGAATMIVYAVSFGISIAGTAVSLVLAAIGKPEAGNVASIAINLGSAPVQAVLQLGLTAMCIGSLTGRPLRLGALVAQWRKLGKLIVQWLFLIPPALVLGGLLVGPALALGLLQGKTESFIALVAMALLLAVPAMYLMLGVYFMQFELAYDDHVGPVDAIARSWQLARGQRLPIFGIAMLGGVIMVSGVAVCCVGLLASIPLGTLVFTGLYLALRNGSGLRVPARASS